MYATILLFQFSASWNLLQFYIILITRIIVFNILLFKLQVFATVQGFEIILPDKATMEHILVPAVEALSRKDMKGTQYLFGIAL